MNHKKIPDIVRGHEIWLEPDVRHAHIGETIECKLYLGHNMSIDGLVDIENVKAVVFDPENKKHDLTTDAGDGYLVAKFDPDLDGYHTFAVEYDAGIFTVTDKGWNKGPKSEYENVKSSSYYYQYAKTILSGHGSKDLNPAIGHELEIIPINFRHYHAGEEIELSVLYDGSALKECVITATFSGNEGDAVEATTNSNGIASFKLDISGNWMFKVRHADPGKSVAGQYDEKVITAVLTVMGVH